jgi:hypothetical protein
MLSEGIRESHTSHYVSVLGLLLYAMEQFLTIGNIVLSFLAVYAAKTLLTPGFGELRRLGRTREYLIFGWFLFSVVFSVLYGLSFWTRVKEGHVSLDELKLTEGASNICLFYLAFLKPCLINPWFIALSLCAIVGIVILTTDSLGSHKDDIGNKDIH